jgi:hypothetical protein
MIMEDLNVIVTSGMRIQRDGKVVVEEFPQDIVAINAFRCNDRNCDSVHLQIDFKTGHVISVMLSPEDADFLAASLQSPRREETENLETVLKAN